MRHRFIALFDLHFLRKRQHFPEANIHYINNTNLFTLKSGGDDIKDAAIITSTRTKEIKHLHRDQIKRAKCQRTM